MHAQLLAMVELNEYLADQAIQATESDHDLARSWNNITDR